MKAITLTAFVLIMGTICLRADSVDNPAKNPFESICFENLDFKDYTIHQLGDLIVSRINQYPEYSGKLKVVISKRNAPYKADFTFKSQPRVRLTLGQLLNYFSNKLDYGYVKRKNVLLLGDNPLARLLKEEDVDRMDLETGKIDK